MVGLYFLLSFAQFRRGGECLAHGLSIDLTGQAEIRAMTGLVRQMTAAVWLSTSAADRGNRATAKIPQFHDLSQKGGTLLFKAGKGVGQVTPPLLTYHYVRSMATTKGTCCNLLSTSRTPSLSTPPRDRAILIS